MIKYHKESLAPNSSYPIRVEFAKIMEVKGPRQKNELLYLIVGLISGLVIVLIDIIKTITDRPETVSVDLEPLDLSFVNMANIFYPKSQQNKKGISAAVFSLAYRKKIKLISKLKKKIFGQKSADIKTKILAKKGLTKIEKILIEGLKENEDLEKFMKDNKTATKVIKSAREGLTKKGLLNKKKLDLRKKIVILSVIFIALSVITVLVGFLSGITFIFGLSIFLMVYGLGSLIKLAFLPVLSAEGIALKRKIEDLLDNKKEIFESQLEKDKEKALAMFFRELPFLVLHPKFNYSQLKKYKKEFKDVKEFKKPHWIDFDLSELDTTIEALDVVEVIDYILLSTIIVASYTSAGAAGAAGGGAA
jgi:uncharacterized protein YbcI